MSAIPAYRPLRLCSHGGGFEAIPDRAMALDLRTVRHRLEAEGVEVVDARVMLIVRGDPELTVSRSGRVLVKSADLASAEAAWKRFWRLALAAPPSGGPRTG